MTDTQETPCTGLFGRIFGHRFVRYGVALKPVTCFRCGFTPRGWR